MNPRVKHPALCVFDLDGTLVDSLRDVAEALNECLELLGIEPHPIDHYRFMVGEGIPKLCQRAIGPTRPHLVDRLIELSRPRYRARPIRHTRPYPGINELVATLRGRGVRLAVLSNKPHEMTVQMVRHFWPHDTFESIQGYVAEEGRKPDPAGLLKICDDAGVRPADACLIGDTPTDVLTARNAATGLVAVTWGFRPRADLEQAGAEVFADDAQQVLVALGL